MISARPPAPRSRAPGRVRLLALAAAALLAGCANSDFGEVHPVLVTDHIHDWVGPYAAGTTHSSRFQLTDDERELRDLAYPLIEPPYDRQQWYSVAGEYGLIHARGPGVSVPTYWHRLSATWRRSPSSAYEQIIDDARNDTTRLSGFFECATRVIDIDHKRRRSMALIPDLSPKERANAARRMRENSAIVELVHASLLQRVASYRYALGRLVVESPSPRAVQAEQTINSLRAGIARYRFPAPTWERGNSLAYQP